MQREGVVMELQVGFGVSLQKSGHIGAPTICVVKWNPSHQFLGVLPIRK